MAIPKTPSQKSQYGKLNKRLAQYVSLVQLLYEKYNKRAAQIAISDGYTGEGEYHFDSVKSKKLIGDVQKEFVSELRSLIYSGITKEWTNSNQIQDLLADRVLDFYEVTNKKGERYKKYYQTNSDALKAFQQRRDNGLNLSQKLWKQADEYKTALEETISTAIQRGNSAVTLSKRVSQYLLDFDKMRSDYTDKFGKKSKALDCEYKSIRLARSEINMAYRTAEQERWRQMDFILGYEIKLSKAHKIKDVCDCLAGKYPKDFNWTGWHPNDMCYAVPIIMSDEQFWGFDEDGNDVEDTPRYVHDVPAGFKHWVEDNKNRIKIADSRGTLPYFLRDNKQFYQAKNAFILPNKLVSSYESIAVLSGVNKAKFTGAISEQNLKDVTEWLSTLPSNSIEIPENIEISSRCFVGSYSNAICVFVPDENLIAINPAFNLDAVNDALKLSPKYASSDNKYHLFNHENGHRLNYLINKDIYINFVQQALPPIEADLARRFVSESCYNVHEFVAEVFAGLAGGRKYGRDIMDMYIKYGGVVL